MCKIRCDFATKTSGNVTSNENNMSTLDDDENVNLENIKHEAFKIDDYEKEIDSDDFYSDVPEANNDENVRID